MTDQQMMRVIAEKLGWPIPMQENLYEAADGGNYLYAFIAYAEAELSKRAIGYEVVASDALHNNCNVAFGYKVDESWDNGIITFDPTDPSSVATAKLKAMVEVLS